MDIVFCIIVFIMGTVFGSFFTLAVYRIPLGLDITHSRSFCPKCNHRLEFIDLIPVLSYISLRGKCRYCGEKVRIRYLVLEVLSGLVFLLAYLSFNMNFPFFEINKLVDFAAFVMFYVTLVIILGIDKENIKINKSVLLFGIIMQFVYILYLYISAQIVTFDIYRYGMYLILMLIIFLLDTLLLSKKGESSYFLQILMLLDYMLMCVKLNVFLFIIALGMIFALIYWIFKKVECNFSGKPDILLEQKSRKFGVGFCFSVSAILVVIINNFIIF